MTDGSKVLRHCFSTQVGRKSRIQEESEEDRIADLTSASEAKANFERIGTQPLGKECGDVLSGESLEFSKQILSLKKERKDDASKDEQECAGREEVLVR